MNNYELEKIVGQGSYGKALLCKRKTDGKRCIIKQISITKLSKKELKATEQESCILSKLSHPNIVAFWESIVTPQYLNIVMEYADGGDLTKYIENRQSRLILESQVLHLFVQISLAIKHIHDRKILHRDLKSENIFLTSSGLCKLGDFGVSRVLKNTGELAATQIGTPYYMSPEIMDGKKYNSKTDIWSLGCILYELLCLKLPFDGNNIKQLAYNIIRSPPPSPPAIYSNEIKELVSSMLAKSSKVRPSISSILSKPVIRRRISDFLDEAKMEGEFNHTILHGADILNGHIQSLSPPNPPTSVNRIAIPIRPPPSVPQSAPQSISQQQLLQPPVKKIEPSNVLNKEILLKQQRERLAALQKEREKMLANLAKPLSKDDIPDVYEQITKFKNQVKPIQTPISNYKKIELSPNKNLTPANLNGNVKANAAVAAAVQTPPRSKSPKATKVRTPLHQLPAHKQLPPKTGVVKQPISSSNSPTIKSAPAQKPPINIPDSSKRIPIHHPSSSSSSSKEQSQQNSPAQSSFTKIANQPISSPPTSNLATPVKQSGLGQQGLGQKQETPFTPDSLNPCKNVPNLGNKPRIDMKEDWLHNLEEQLQGVKSQMEMLKQADFPSRSPAKSPLPPPTPSIESSSFSSPSIYDSNIDNNEPKARIVIKGMDKNWLNDLEGRMGDLKQQMKQLQADSSSRSPSRSRSPRRLDLPSEESCQNQLSNEAVTKNPILARPQSSPSPNPNQMKGIKDLSSVERVKWYTELEGKMSGLMGQIEYIKKQSPVRKLAFQIEPVDNDNLSSKPDPIPTLNQGIAQVKSVTPSNATANKPWQVQGKAIYQPSSTRKSPSTVMQSKPSPPPPPSPIPHTSISAPSSKSKIASASRRPSALQTPDSNNIGGGRVGAVKSITPKQKVQQVIEIQSSESKEKLEHRKQIRDFERADFKEFIRAQKMKAKKREDGMDLDMSVSPIPSIEIQDGSSNSPKNVGFVITVDPNMIVDQAHSNDSHLVVENIVKPKPRSPIPVSLSNFVDKSKLLPSNSVSPVNEDDYSKKSTSKTQRDMEREEMRKMIADRRKQNQSVKHKQGDEIDMENIKSKDMMVFVKEPKYPIQPFVPQSYEASFNNRYVSKNKIDSMDNSAYQAVSEQIDNNDSNGNNNNNISSSNVMIDNSDDVLNGTWHKSLNQNVDMVTAMEYSFLLSQMQQILLLPSNPKSKRSDLVAVNERSSNDNDNENEDEGNDEDTFEEEDEVVSSLDDDEEQEIEELVEDFTEDEGDKEFSEVTQIKDEKYREKVSSITKTVPRLISKRDMNHLIENSSSNHEQQNENGDYNSDNGSIATLESIESDFVEILDEERIKYEIEEVSNKSFDEIKAFLVSKLGKARFYESFKLLSSIDTLVETNEDEEEFLSAIEDILGPDGLPYLELLYRILSN